VNIDDMAIIINQTAKEHGFYEDDEGKPIKRNFGEVIALMHSELSEALEEHRSGKPIVYFAEEHDGRPAKPEGAAVELADCVIRILDTMHEMLVPVGGMSIEALILMKMKYNDSRPYKHGRKY